MAPKLSNPQDVVILECVGIAVVHTVGNIARDKPPSLKALMAAGLLAAGLSAVAIVNRKVAVGLGTLALAGSVVVATVGSEAAGTVAARQLQKVGSGPLPTAGRSAVDQWQAMVNRIETAIAAQVESAGDEAAEGARTAAGAVDPSIPAPGGFSKPFKIPYPKPGPHGSARNAFGGDAVDIMVPKGTPIYAVQGGVIGTQFGPLASDPSSVLAGIRLHVLTPDGNDWYYAHLDRVAPGIKPGVRVRAGQLLGYVGVANNVAHLHLEDKFQTVRRRV